MDCWLNVGIRGSAIWPVAETVVEFGGHKLVLRPATRETEQSVHINLRGIADVDALTLINRFLSMLSWCDDQPMENRYGWSGNPVPVAIPRESRSIGSAVAFPFQRNLGLDEKTQLALALYREGRSINSIPFSFLSYFKILNICWKDKYVKGRNEIIEGLRSMLPKITDEPAVRRIKELESSEADVPRYLYDSGRCAIAHAYADPIVDPDDVADLRRLSQDLEVIKAVAEYLILMNLGVSSSITG